MTLMAVEDDPKLLLRGVAPPGEKAPVTGWSPATLSRRMRRLFRIATTGGILLAALAAASQVWTAYVTAPWTRDGRVRVQVANIAPQVSGQIVKIGVADNQTVREGDVLYEIDPVDFEVAVASADAEVKVRESEFEVKSAQAGRRQALSTVSTSVEEKQIYAGDAKAAAGALESARARLRQARVNLERTRVVSTVNGRVTNLLMRVGDYARSGTSNVSVVDTGSFWVDGYFEETKMANVHVGDAVEVTLLGYSRHLRGTVGSLTLGISTADAAPSTQGLPDVNPVYTWVRLAQRVPVRVRLDRVPSEVLLVAGMTASVTVEPDRAPDSRSFDLRHFIQDRFVRAYEAVGGLARYLYVFA